MTSTTIPAQHHGAPAFTWTDLDAWKRAATNTFTCLIGCSIGDFGALILIQIYWPSTPMLLTMAIAMSAGIFTSILFETALLRIREGFAWRRAVRVAISMSLISMLGMELAANTTDMILTGGGAVPPSEPWYWGALAISLLVGFLAPLPYNYYALKKHGKACHHAG